MGSLKLFSSSAQWIAVCIRPADPPPAITTTRRRKRLLQDHIAIPLSQLSLKTIKPAPQPTPPAPHPDRAQGLPRRQSSAFFKNIQNISYDPVN